MMIRMTIAVPLEHLHATVKFFDKNSIVIRGTEMVQSGLKKERKYLTEEERKAVKAIKDRSRGQAVQVAQNFGVTPGVIRSIWK